jgi:hypothetical protein
MIVQIQGASGAGKSTMVRLLMAHLEKLGAKRDAIEDDDGRVLGYRFDLTRRKKTRSFYFVGKYETPCGGCDQVGSAAEVVRRVQRWAKGGDVLFEGLLISSCQGTVGLAMQRYGKRFAYVFLDTPLKTCLRRVEQRRRARARKRGAEPLPLNPKNTTNKWRGCVSYRARAYELGYRVEVADWRDPLPTLLRLFNLENAK